ncbi:MAG: M28 family peptidase, partial [Chthoniobacteraceae bacterium]
MRALFALLAVALGACAGCSSGKKSESAPPIEIPAKLWEQFSGEKAMREVERQVGFGPHPTGSAAIVQARDHIITTLKAHGWDVERQEFDLEPVPGKGSLHFVNIIARFSKSGRSPAPRDTQRAIIGSHYDTKRMSGIRFVGANDGGSSTGALLEMARVLALAPDLAARVELVFFDGEEAVEQFGPAETGPDGLVGSRHYAHVLRESGRAAQFRFAIVWDMIGDADLDVT